MNNIIFMEPIFKDYIWGGKKLNQELGKNSSYINTAESWEISANENGSCKILNEEYKNRTLTNLFNDKKIKKDIFGSKCENMKFFPLLIKFIDARDDLSIQVHPDDQYAKVIGQANGKNELWYIIDCNENSQIIAGLNKKIGTERLEDTIKNNTIKNYLNYINIKKGDSIYIEAGMLHAILKNNLICEIQQNCDITYRVYDWDRIDKNGNSRTLHKNEAIKTINPNIVPIITHTDNNRPIQNIVKTKYFITDKINCIKTFKDISSKDSFYAINVVKGNGIIRTNKKELKIKKGDSFIIPATLGTYEMYGKIEFLKTYLD